MAAAKGVWLELHAEPVSADRNSHYVTLTGGIALLFRLNPRFKLILPHTGMTSSKNARALLDTNPNLLMNLKIVLPGKALHWEHLEPIQRRGRIVRGLGGIDGGNSPAFHDRFRRPLRHLEISG